MKIVELLTEAPPGVVDLEPSMYSKYIANPIKQKLSSRRDKKQKQQLIKQNQQKWYAAVKARQQKGINMNNEDVYRKELYNFLSGNGKLKLNINFVNLLKTAELTDKNIREIMSQAIDQRIRAKERLAKKSQQANANPAPTAESLTK